MFILSDTGYWESPDDAIARCDMESFAPVENSRTKLLLMAAPSGIWDPDPLIEDDTWMKTLFSSPKPILTPKEKGIVITQSFDLHEFINADMTDQRLATFIGQCHLYGIPLPALSTTL